MPVRYLAKLKTWIRRQEVDPHGFVSDEELKKWKGRNGDCDIISVSHVWETREHPDPLGFQLGQVLKILEEKGWMGVIWPDSGEMFFKGSGWKFRISLHFGTSCSHPWH